MPGQMLVVTMGSEKPHQQPETVGLAAEACALSLATDNHSFSTLVLPQKPSYQTYNTCFGETMFKLAFNFA